jgi:hypothetical protein
VARKYYSPISTRSTLENAAVNLRLATLQLAKLRFSSTLKKIQPPRKLMAVAFVTQPTQEIKIRHAIQNLGSFTEKPRTVQSLPA